MSLSACSCLMTITIRPLRNDWKYYYHRRAASHCLKTSGDTVRLLQRTTHFISLKLFRRLRKIAKSDYWLISSVRPHKELCYHGTDFHKIWYQRLYRRYVEINHVSLKYNKNNAYFTRRTMYILTVCSWILLRTRNISHKRRKENQNIYFVSNNIPPPPQSCRLWEYGKNMIRPDRPQMTLYGACALHAG
jgi:hypothetical protein